MPLVEVLFLCWLVEIHFLSPLIFTGLVSLLTWLKGANMCLAAESDKNIVVANDKLKKRKREKKKAHLHEKFWQSCSVHLHSWCSDSTQLYVSRLLWVCWPQSACHAWFSLALWFVAFNVLCTMSTVHWIISPPPPTSTNLKFRCTKSLQCSSLVESSGLHSNVYTDLLPRS